MSILYEVEDCKKFVNGYAVKLLTKYLLFKCKVSDFENLFLEHSKSRQSKNVCVIQGAFMNIRHVSGQEFPLTII